MRETARVLDSEFVCAFANLERCSSATDVVVDLGVALRRHASTWRRVVEAVRAVPELVEEVGVG